MDFESLKESIVEQLNAVWDKVTESTAYIQIMEKYEQLPIKAQKAVVAGICALLFLIVLSIPQAFMSSAGNSIDKFEARRSLLRDLMKTERDLKQAPNVGFQPPPGVLTNQARQILDAEGLTEEQVVNIAPFKKEAGAPEKSKLIPKALEQNGIIISLKKLNLTQIKNISYQLHRKEKSAKLLAMDISTNRDNDHYFDVQYRLANFNLPKEDEAPEKDSASKKKSRRARR